MKISVVTPAFNERENLPAAYERIRSVLTSHAEEWEWIVVDDHSADGTLEVVRQLAARDPRVRGVRLAKNSGSHVAIACGIQHARGDAVVMLAADLQDPPEVVPELLARWRAGAQVVWAVRRQRPGEPVHRGFAALYYWIMRRLVGLTTMPSRGADFFLLDNVVADAVRRSSARNTSLLALITWLGFRQEFVEYDKQARVAGASGWTRAKNVKLVVDSVTGFSDFPIRWCGYAGIALVCAAVPVAVAGVVLLPSLGAGLLLILAIVFGLSGVQLVALAVIGTYVWRALDEARGRPVYSIEADANGPHETVSLES